MASAGLCFERWRSCGLHLASHTTFWLCGTTLHHPPLSSCPRQATCLPAAGSLATLGPTAALLPTRRSRARLPLEGTHPPTPHCPSRHPSAALHMQQLRIPDPPSHYTPHAGAVGVRGPPPKQALHRLPAPLLQHAPNDETQHRSPCCLHHHHHHPSSSSSSSCSHSIITIIIRCVTESPSAIR